MLVANDLQCGNSVCFATNKFTSKIPSRGQFFFICAALHKVTSKMSYVKVFAKYILRYVKSIH